jgi:hypothetical protein
MKDTMLVDSYTGKLFGTVEAASNRIMIGIPMTGLLRCEWVLARYGQVIPCNWSQVDCIQFLDQWSPIGFLVAEARNIIASACVEQGFEWLFFIDHDTIIPPNTILKWNDRMLKKDVPVFSGLYFTRSLPSEPLVYRGRGTSYYKDWKVGEEVWVDGLPMGCTMIHSSILKVLYDESPEITLSRGNVTIKVREIFETPARSYFDPEKLSWYTATGTEDMAFCTRVMKDNVFKKAGWPEFQEKEFPFLIDTSVFCKHIDNNGVQYPSNGEEQEFISIVEK